LFPRRFGVAPGSVKVRCPICRREVAWEGNPWRPFCSDRCRTIDLGNWAAERYRIPGEPLRPEPDDEGEEESS
jgi:endogenous inhibitor of DNA gyrase (YacG/DUF329 family)